ncbi:MAG: hypothetical protein AMR96_06150 [Candidatus Adiutrix intracellularis]|nr:MAG: hypothetical protein AMR96_06150 [Candidatus Adiutrix intracellularis]
MGWLLCFWLFGPVAVCCHMEAAFNFNRCHYCRPIAVGNYNYYLISFYEYVIKQGFMREYLAKFGLKLVLELVYI